MKTWLCRTQAKAPKTYTVCQQGQNEGKEIKSDVKMCKMNLMRAGIKMSREEVPEVRDQERRESYLENVNAQRRRLMKRRMEMRDDHRKPSGGIMQS